MTPYKKTGKLLSTVKAGKQGTKVVITIGNNTTAKYAALQNFGSKRKNVEARYFMQMGIRRTRDYVLNTYLDALQKLINKYERKVN
jgi:phage gpG-like protein